METLTNLAIDALTWKVNERGFSVRDFAEKMVRPRNLGELDKVQRIIDHIYADSGTYYSREQVWAFLNKIKREYREGLPQEIPYCSPIACKGDLVGQLQAFSSALPKTVIQDRYDSEKLMPGFCGLSSYSTGGTSTCTATGSITGQINNKKQESVADLVGYFYTRRA